MADGPDRWYRWLTDARFGGDPRVRERVLSELLYPMRDAVLDKAGLRAGETLLDVGTGDGLVGFGALDRSAPSGRVIFSDISSDLLEHCRQVVSAEGQEARCSFVQVSAESLTGVMDASVDVVTTRSVLIYVKDKAAALAEFYRVLRPGGRVSMFEPINRLMGLFDPARFLGYDTRPVAPIAAKVKALYESIQPPDSDPMFDFDDRDLVRFAEDAGFGEVGLELQVSVKPEKPIEWDVLMRISGNPRIPPFGEAMERALSAREAADFTDYLRPLVESGAGQQRRAGAYLTAVKSRRR